MFSYRYRALQTEYSNRKPELRRIGSVLRVTFETRCHGCTGQKEYFISMYPTVCAAFNLCS